MSTKISKSALKELLRKLIVKELEEVSTTATAGGSYSTPHAFSGKGKKDRRKDIASGSGYDEVNEVMFAVKINKDGNEIQTIVDASSKGQAKTKVGKLLKGGLKDIVGVSRVQPSFGKQIDKKLENVKEGRYHQYRNDDTLTAKQKIGISMREVRDKLTELSKLIDMNVKLKNELSVDSRSYWKNTHKAMSKISERLVKLANKVGKLQ
jgi:hypothetical protein